MPKFNKRNMLQGLVHKGAKILFGDDDLRRDWQKDRTGHSSCKDMSIEQLDDLVKELRSKGALTPAPRKKHPNSGRRYGPKSRGAVADVIRALWINMHQEGIVDDPAESAIGKYVKRMTAPHNDGLGVDNLEWLWSNPKLEQRVLESLKQWRKRVWKQWLKEDIEKIPTGSTEEDVLALIKAKTIRYHHEFYEWWGIHARCLGIAPTQEAGTRQEDEA